MHRLYPHQITIANQFIQDLAAIDNPKLHIVQMEVTDEKSVVAAVEKVNNSLTYTMYTDSLLSIFISREKKLSK